MSHNAGWKEFVSLRQKCLASSAKRHSQLKNDLQGRHCKNGELASYLQGNRHQMLAGLYYVAGRTFRKSSRDNPNVLFCLIFTCSPEGCFWLQKPESAPPLTRSIFVEWTSVCPVLVGPSVSVLFDLPPRFHFGMTSLLFRL